MVVIRATGRPTVRRRSGHDEARLPPTEAQLHGPGGQVGGDLAGRITEGIEQGQPDSRIDGGEQALGQGPGVLPAGLGRREQLVVHVLDVSSQLHGTTMAPQRCHVYPFLARARR